MDTKRQAIIETAMKLFYAHGFHAVGIDRIIAESGVAKMTMYKYFPSKRLLINTVLEERDHFFQTSLENFVAKAKSTEDKIKAIFEWHDRWLHERSFNGCLFIKAALEFADPKDEIHKFSKLHKQRILKFISDILKDDMDTGTAQELGWQLLLLLEGAIATAQIFGDRDAAKTAWQAATTLLKTA
ncbi:MAG: TetR/AcrR family transcriptional regulator [Pseudomonadales bacterium]|jgi:AcrR family transcriptional regulator|nr:TetR/AcrR family transcriptional regulator [Pseudomonadales bacterium]